MLSYHLILYHSLLLLPSIFPSIGVFFNESVLCIKWPKYWSFSFSISPSDEHSGLISFRMDWFDLPWYPRDSQESSPTTTVQNHQLLGTQPSLWYSSHIHTWLLEKPLFWLYQLWLCQMPRQKKNLLEEAWGQGLQGCGEAVAAGTSGIRQLLVHLPSPYIQVVWRKLVLGVLSGSPGQPFWVGFDSRPLCCLWGVDWALYYVDWSQ